MRLSPITVQELIMRVFVTGGSGLIGSAVIPDLVEAGHEVVGLARSEESAAAVTALGAQARRGDLADLAGLRDAVSWADGVIHLAFDHTAMRAGDMAGAAATDMTAVRTIADTLAGTGKAMVALSGTLILAGLGRVGTEDDPDIPMPGNPRSEVAKVIIGLGERGVRVPVVRIPPVVHGDLDRHGFLPTLIGIARETGVAGYLGDGANRWPAGHALDVGRVFRLALEKAPSGARLHPVGDEGLSTRLIAEAIGRNLGVPTESFPAEQADRFRFLAPFMALDNAVSTARTREMLGWAPAHPGLIADLDEGHYFGAGR
jgi:nucleoside-diphosphate-sugar epimerase